MMQEQVRPRSEPRGSSENTWSLWCTNSSQEHRWIGEADLRNLRYVVDPGLKNEVRSYPKGRASPSRMMPDQPQGKTKILWEIRVKVPWEVKSILKKPIHVETQLDPSQDRGHKSIYKPQHLECQRKRIKRGTFGPHDSIVRLRSTRDEIGPTEASGADQIYELIQVQA